METILRQSLKNSVEFPFRNADKISSCHLAYTDDVDLFADVLLVGIQVIMAHKAESTKTIIEKIKVRLTQ